MNLRPRHLFSFLIWSSAALPLSAQKDVLPLSPTEEQKEKEQKENEDARFRIPLGAVVSDVTLPYYGKNKQPISLLTAEEMRVEGADPSLNPELDSTEVQRLNGKGLKLWLFDKQGLVKSTTTIPKAQYHVKEERIITSGNLVMKGADNKFSTHSQGAIFTLKTGQVLLLGPGSTRLSLPQKKETSMNLRPLSPLLPLSALMQVLIAAPPEIDPQHLEKFEEAVASARLPETNAQQRFADAELQNAALAKRLAEYLLQVGKTELLTQIADPPVTEPDPFDAPFDFGPSDISIEFDKGAYFDSETLEVAYFGNIKVEGLGLKMTCNKDLKAIFHPPAPKKQKKNAPKKDEKKKDDSPMQNFSGFGDLKQVTANGRIRLEGTDKEGKKFYLRGDRALFESDPKNPQKEGVITLRGDRLSFIKGDPLNKDSEEPIIRGDATTKNAWAIVSIKQGLDPSKSDVSVQFSQGNFKIGVINRKKK